MDNRDVIRVFHWSPLSRHATMVEPADLKGPPEEGWVWIDMEGADPSEVIELGQRFGVDQSVLEEATASANFPLLEEHADYLYIVIRGYQTGSGERLRTSAADVFVGSRFVLTIHEGALPTVGWLQERIEQGAELAAFGPVTLLAHLALAGSRRFVPLIHELESQIDGLEELAMTGDPRTLTEVHALRRDVILLHRVLGPQSRVYEDLVDSDHPVIDTESRRVFEKVANHQTRVMESFEAARAMLGSVLETHRGAVADQTNEIVRILTVFSAVLLPLGLIAGIWGMNFIRLPGAEKPTGFWIMLGAMGVIAVALWLYFARRGFVGAPRVSELPKAVGLGLIQVGTAPIRIVAGGIESTVRYVTGAGQEEQPEE